MQVLCVTPSLLSCRSSTITAMRGTVKEVGGQNPAQRSQNCVKLFKSLTPPLMAAFLFFSPVCYPPVSLGKTIDVQRGATLFQRSCIGCHVGGGNILQPGATLFINDLERNGVAMESEIYSLTYNGKGRMPGFGENCMPKGRCTFGPRLQEEEIRLLSEYVKLQADEGWPNIQNHGDD